MLSLFLAISRSSGDSFLVVVGTPVVLVTVVVDVDEASLTSSPSALDPLVVVGVADVVVDVVVVVVVVGLVFGASGERPKTGNFGLGLLVVVTVGRVSIGLSVGSCLTAIGPLVLTPPDTCLAVGNSSRP